MSGIVLIGLAFVLLIVLMRTIKIVPQKQVKIIERLGKYHRTAEAGLNTIVPFLDSVRATIDLREQITKIEPQPVITRDNVTMEVDAVIYYLVADPVRSTYEVQNLPWGLEQLTLSALRNVIGQLDLDHTLSSRDTTFCDARPGVSRRTRNKLPVRSPNVDTAATSTTTRPISGWLTQLNRSQFQIFGYHTGVEEDGVTKAAPSTSGH